jgi:serine/threonine-protein kinase HipA
MNRCPITYEICEGRYSSKGLKLLSRKLKDLLPFPYSSEEQIQLANIQAGKLSIQGVQPKLSIVLNVAEETFEIAEKGGRYILKPPHPNYKELPENEDLTMKLAQIAGIEVPLHGMIYNKDNSLSYFIKRFDRLAKKQKVAVEDFSQLLSSSRYTKYDSSMEKAVSVIDKHCSFPKLEKIKFFKLALFNFLVGNEDMHLKNFSIITRNGKVELSPAYDLLNTTIVLNAKEEMAIPLNGKKSNMKSSDFFEYFAINRLRLNREIVDSEVNVFLLNIPIWKELISQSFLSKKSKELYENLLIERSKRLLEH